MAHVRRRLPHRPSPPPVEAEPQHVEEVSADQRAGEARVLGEEQQAGERAGKPGAAEPPDLPQGTGYSPPFCCATMQYSIGIDSMVLKREAMPAIFAAAAFCSGATLTMPSAFF